ARDVADRAVGIGALPGRPGVEGAEICGLRLGSAHRPGARDQDGDEGCRPVTLDHSHRVKIPHLWNRRAARGLSVMLPPAWLPTDQCLRASEAFGDHWRQI